MKYFIDIWKWIKSEIYFKRQKKKLKKDPYIYK
jgi:hypothetical protein